jgi:hypothetical protein
MRRVLPDKRGVAGFGACGHQPGTLGARLKSNDRGAGGHTRSQRDRVAGERRCHAAREMPALAHTTAREPRPLFGENGLRPSASGAAKFRTRGNAVTRTVHHREGAKSAAGADRAGSSKRAQDSQRCGETRAASVGRRRTPYAPTNTSKEARDGGLHGSVSGACGQGGGAT